MSLTSLGIFRWLREVADSSSVESQNTELPWKTGHSRSDRAPGSRQPPASPPDPVIQRIYIHKYFKAERGRSQGGYAAWIPAKGRDLFPSRGRRGCGATGLVPCPGILSQILA